MRIRAITIGQIIPFLYKDEIIESFLAEKLENFHEFNTTLVETLKDVNIFVESRRLCSQPLFSYDDEQMYTRNLEDTILQLHEQFTLVDKLIEGKFDYVSCCSMLANQLKDFSIFEKLFLSTFPEFLRAFPKLFSSLPVASSKSGINLAALKSGAHIIKELSVPDPINNLQFCVSANVPPNIPFFPAAYHLSDNPAFSIAIEMADEVSRSFRAASSLVEAKYNLRKKFEQIYDAISVVCEDVAKNFNIRFVGMDFSPAPYPKLTRSIGYAIEKLNSNYFGAHGTLLAVALIKKCIPNKPKIIGFSGFMQPVLEDYIIAKRVAEERFCIDTLLLNSAICGTGLDCIPLPGDITEREIFYILLDVCVLSVILDKPLTARLIPLPGKNAGDDVSFDFEYFAETKVMPYKKLLEEEKEDIFYKKEKFFHFY
ncbi:MAG: DUF711 family protein [Promethearchaeota archaeon]